MHQAGLHLLHTLSKQPKDCRLMQVLHLARAHPASPLTPTLTFPLRCYVPARTDQAADPKLRVPCDAVISQHDAMPIANLCATRPLTG